jgi:trk system potassium uptake protein TrkH
VSTTFAPRSRRVPNLAAHVVGAALLFVSAGILMSALVELGAGGDEVASMALASGIVAGVGAAVWRATTIPPKTTASQTFVAVGATWVSAAVAGAVPFVLAGVFPTIDNALFESVSGFTGTGSTVLSPIEEAPRGILFWRSMTQWYGGTGMVVLAVAILPFLGIGGMDLLRAEAPGPSADRLAPRVSETAKRLWFVYGAFTVVSAVVLLVVGLSPFDAVTHAFTVVSTGGLSPYDNSIAAFDSVVVEGVLVVLMLYGATNFAIHWRFVTGDVGAYRSSSMFRFYMQVFVSFTVLIALLLVWRDDFGLGRAVRDAIFNVATLLTSTGFGTADYVQWNAAAQLLLLALMVSGGMAGSTAGGMKLIRVRILFRSAAREIARVRHPRAALPVKLGDEVVPERTVSRVVGYVLFYVLFILVGTVALALLGAGLPEAVGAATSAMGNMGPALGEAGPASNFLVYSRPARGLLMVMMFAGRLEIFPVIFLISRIVGPLRAGTVRRVRIDGRLRPRIRLGAG